MTCEGTARTLGAKLGALVASCCPCDGAIVSEENIMPWGRLIWQLHRQGRTIRSQTILHGSGRLMDGWIGKAVVL